MILKKIFIVLTFIMVGLAGYLGANVHFVEQWILYEALRTTASIIFAVVGVWLAIVYPDRLKSPFSPSLSNPIYQKGFKQLFSPVISSVFILSIVLLMGFLAPLLKQVKFAVQHTLFLRQASFSLLASLTMWQIYTVLSVLVPLINILDKYDNDRHANEIINKLKGKSD